MRARTAQWFECKIKYEKTLDDGLEKMVTEQYVINALSFAEAETEITERMSQYISGEFEVKEIKPAAYDVIFFMNEVEKMFDNQVEDLMHAVKKGDKEKGKEVYERNLEDYTTDTRYYKAKLAFITNDEKSGKEKRSNATYLVEACSLRGALDNIDAVMKGTKIDYVQANVGETRIEDVFENVPKSGE